MAVKIPSTYAFCLLIAVTSMRNSECCLLLIYGDLSFNIKFELTTDASYPGSLLVAWDGECSRDALWAGSRCRAVQHARYLYAKVMDNHRHHHPLPYARLPLCISIAKSSPPGRTHIRDCWKVLQVGNPAAVRLRRQLPGPEVPSVPKQGLGDDRDLGCSLGSPRWAELAAHYEVPSGPARGCNGWEHIVVVHRFGSDGLRGFWLLPRSVDRSVFSGFQVTRGLCEVVTGICCHAVVSHHCQ